MTKDIRRDDDALWFLNSRIILRRMVSDRGEAVCVAEHRLPRGDSPPLHLHAREDEVFHLLEGSIRFRIGEQEVMAGAGETLVAPKGVPHSFRVESDEAHMLTFTVGGDFEAMVREVARPAGPGLPPFAAPTADEAAALDAACARHGIALVGPPLAA